MSAYLMFHPSTLHWIDSGNKFFINLLNDNFLLMSKYLTPYCIFIPSVGSAPIKMHEIAYAVFFENMTRLACSNVDNGCGIAGVVVGRDEERRHLLLKMGGVAYVRYVGEVSPGDLLGVAGTKAIKITSPVDKRYVVGTCIKVLSNYNLALVRLRNFATHTDLVNVDSFLLPPQLFAGASSGSRTAVFFVYAKYTAADNSVHIISTTEKQFTADGNVSGFTKHPLHPDILLSDINGDEIVLYLKTSLHKSFATLRMESTPPRYNIKQIDDTVILTPKPGASIADLDDKPFTITIWGVC